MVLSLSRLWAPHIKNEEAGLGDLQGPSVGPGTQVWSSYSTRLLQQLEDRGEAGWMQWDWLGAGVPRGAGSEMTAEGPSDLVGQRWGTRGEASRDNQKRGCRLRPGDLSGSLE